MGPRPGSVCPSHNPSCRPNEGELASPPGLTLTLRPVEDDEVAESMTQYAKAEEVDDRDDDDGGEAGTNDA